MNAQKEIANERRVVIWFSCGVTSAVAAKLAISKYGKNRCEIVYTDTSSEHEDNRRFLKDCEKWFGKSVTTLKSEKYSNIWDVFEKTRYLVGPRGARCTTELKKVLRHDFQRVDDIQVFGFDAGEDKRAERFRINNPEVTLETPLIDKGLTKSACLALLRKVGIKEPAIYSLGYKNANCIGCVKGQAGYWNKIRVDFPEVFKRMAIVERKLNVAINKSYAGDGKRKRVFLDELPEDMGRYSSEPSIECGLLCEETAEEIENCE
jgi:PP-loop superfamily ATP-utilizing enzyme